MWLVLSYIAKWIINGREMNKKDEKYFRVINPLEWELKLDNTETVQILKSKNPKLLIFSIFRVFWSDLDWIQTSNLLSRNQVRYSVAPQGLDSGANIGVIV